MTPTPTASGRAPPPTSTPRRAASARNRVAWFYPEPKQGFEQLKDHLAFYPRRVDAAYLDDELVTPQPGAYYGGWITEEIEGPFKGEPGSEGW